MENSSFQFKQPVIKKMNFETHEIDFQNDIDIQMENSLSVKVLQDEETNNEAMVILNIYIGASEQKKSPFTLELEMAAMFQWNDIEKERLDILLSQNAPALIYSYARPIISNITGSSEYPAYNIPFMNFTK